MHFPLHRPRVYGCLLLAMCSASRAATGAAWENLPPTPHLPTARASGFAPVNGVKLFFSRFGTGLPVLLLHGGLANADYWGKVIPILVADGFEVVVADSRGHGRSTRSDAAFSYQLMADDVVSLLKFLDIARVDLVGWSDGGIIGLDLAIRHPELLNHLAIYGSNSDPSATRQNFDSTPVFARYLTRVRSEYERLSPTPHDFDRFLSQIQIMWSNQPRYTAVDLAKITTPTLVFDGAHDEAIKREHTEYLARSIPAASLVLLDDVSHFGMLQNPNEFANTVVEFLRPQQAPPAVSHQPSGSHQ